MQVRTLLEGLELLALLFREAQAVSLEGLQLLVKNCTNGKAESDNNQGPQHRLTSSEDRTALVHRAELFALGLVFEERLIHVLAHVRLDAERLDLLVGFRTRIPAATMVGRQRQSPSARRTRASEYLVALSVET
jgi:hypothetical protein